MPVSVGQLIDKFRTEVDDPRVPGGNDSTPDADSLWKDEEIIGYIDEAQIELARRTRLWQTTKTFPYETDQEVLEYPKGYLDLRTKGAYRLDDDEAVPMVVRNMDEMDEEHVDDYGLRPLARWLTQKGLPKVLVTDYDNTGFRIVPIPESSGTIRLMYYRHPVFTGTGSAAYTEFDKPQHIRAVLHWMKALAYQKQDAEALDLRRAELFRMQFEAAVEQIGGEAKRGRRRPGTVSYGGY